MTTVDIDWQRIEQFIGFGRPDANVLFLGMEEGLLPGSDLRADLLARSSYGQTMDLLEAQRGLKDCLKYFGPNAVTQRTWRPMCHLMLRLAGETPTKESRVAYQAYRLGRSNGETLLAELLPYPSHDKGAWPYNALSRFNSRDAYDAKMRPERVAMFRDLVQRERYQIAVCYGKADWNDFKEIFSGAQWRTSGVFEVGSFASTRVVLAPHFSGRAFNAEQQLDEFARVALG